MDGGGDASGGAHATRARREQPSVESAEVMLKRLVLAWEPWAGETGARWVARAHSPLLVVLITLVAGWPIGVLQATTSGPGAHAILSVANGLVFPVVICECVWWVVRLRNRRRTLRRMLAREGLEVDRNPAILSPGRFASWCTSEKLDRGTVRSAIEAGFHSHSGF